MGQAAATPDFPWAHEWPEITDKRVRAAFARVPRAAFVPAQIRQWSDRDEPLPIGEEQTISQPFVVALMTQALNLQPGDKNVGNWHRLWLSDSHFMRTHGPSGGAFRP